jgi:hypothetical protein
MILGISLGVKPAGSVSSPAVVEPQRDGIKTFAGGAWQTFAGTNIEEME